MFRAAGFRFALFAVLITVGALAAAQEVKRTQLQRGDLTGTGMEIIVTLLEAPPGASLPRHFHHGEESLYVLEGALTLEADGKKVMLETGSSGITPRNAPHAGFKVVGEKTLKLLTVHTVDKGKPLATPVP